MTLIGKYITSGALKAEAIQFAEWKHEKMVAGELSLLAEGGERLWFFNTTPHQKPGRQTWVKYTWDDLYEEFKLSRII